MGQEGLQSRQSGGCWLNKGKVVSSQQDFSEPLLSDDALGIFTVAVECAVFPDHGHFFGLEHLHANQSY